MTDHFKEYEFMRSLIGKTFVSASSYVNQATTISNVFYSKGWKIQTGIGITHSIGSFLALFKHSSKELMNNLKHYSNEERRIYKNDKWRNDPYPHLYV